MQSSVSALLRVGHKWKPSLYTLQTGAEICSRYRVIHWLEFKLQINKAILKYFHLWYLGAKLQFVSFRFIDDYSHISIHKTGIQPKLIVSWSSAKWSLLRNYARIRTHEARPDIAVATDRTSTLLGLTLLAYNYVITFTYNYSSWIPVLQKVKVDRVSNRVESFEKITKW